MAEKQWGYSHPHDKKKHVKYPSMPDFESPSSPYGKYEQHDESPAWQPKFGYMPHGVTKVKVQATKKVYDPGYAHAPKQQMPSHHCPPIVCDPQYIVRDCYVPREVPVVHPIVNVNRHVIVNVPRHYYQPVTRNVVVDPGCPGCDGHGYGHY